ncbi:NudC domain-containing protein 2 [Salpingoeca rosetta]|uniref:NudC domain-containing protein 2 n=1 Tax=Salpingoeca rosetta (strain ATCC 50818 / BSB-021) TaxID=946362 RepID=F2U2U0_SALR5|nr:NudC domain-containing protein 2 [Salpingoeca rosetta]EGD81934.1 NudC domain-containing protein 2 [Salpingoeca rosetta]|eukprot:XP_004996117.1 NudC domain-containing protein 2 [Salpingoeca rosetta]
MSDFAERAGSVASSTPWGRWQQTIDEVEIVVDVPKGTRGRDVQVNFVTVATACHCGLLALVDMKPASIGVAVNKNPVMQGELLHSVIVDESTWTIENDGAELHILLIKSHRDASGAWSSLLKDQYELDPLVFDQVQKQLTLERFQRENPGFDFTDAEVTGNYQVS